MVLPYDPSGGLLWCSGQHPGFLPHSKDMLQSLIDDSQLALRGECVSVCGFVELVICLVYSAFAQH